MEKTTAAVVETVKLSRLKSNPNNPRFIKDDKYKNLLESISKFPEMLTKRPLIVFTDATDKKLTVIGGNQRYECIKELKWKQAPVIIADDWTEEMRNEFIIKDNVHSGEWDKKLLTLGWDKQTLVTWEVELPGINFDPVTDPQTNHRQVTAAEMEKAQEGLDEKFKGSRDKFQCICPECGHEFLIDK